MTQPDDFELQGVGRPWQLPDGAPSGLEAHDYYLGEGQNALEVAVALASSPPTRTDMRTLWGKRHGGRPSPVLCVVLYRRSGTWRAAICGPAGEDPAAVLGLDLGHVRRICETALAEPDRHAATRFLMEALPESSEDLPGLRNVGMFATHHLRSGVPTRPDWEEECEKGRQLLDRSGRDLVEGLGFEVEDRGPTTSVLRAEGTARVVAVFLDENESPEGTYQRFGGTSPATHGLAAADRDGLPYVLLTRGRQVRLYATSKEAGVGRKGRAETFVEANLALLPDAAAGYLPLIFSAEALSSGGSFEEVLDRSRDFAAGLGARLRDRVYGDVVPGLARAVVAGEDGADEADLESLYEETLVVLFRLLFVAYAEDRDLLPYRASSSYQHHALKTLARQLADRWNEGPLEFDEHATDLWSEAQQLFAAVNFGNADWQVPPYNGGLFSDDAEVSRVGHAIGQLRLTNAEFGPPLAALLVDRGDDGIYGPVDFRSLSVREFGTIYEGLLESSLAKALSALTVGSDGTYLPANDGEEIAVLPGEIYLHNQSGARKATGSYFTKPFAVEHLLKTALEPAIDDHVKRIQGLIEEGEQARAADAFFDFRCADIAMGSGHFLVAVVDHIEARLSSLLAEQPIPEVIAELERLRARAIENLGDLAAGVEIEQSSLLRRQIARRCIYGVDRNAIAVELARLALWIHTFVPGLPLGLLDRTLVCGDSLTGIGNVEEAAGILKGGDPSEGESLFVDRIDELLGRSEDALRRCGRASDADAREIREARQAASEAREAVQPVQDLFDLLIAVRLDRVNRFEEMTEEVIARHPDLEEARELGRELNALHFPVAFPEVFLRNRPGFDCLVGNPPWEKVKVEEHGFWALRFPGLRAMPVGRQNAEIEQLGRRRPDLANEYEAELRAAESLRELLVIGPYPGMGTGDPDLYKAFAWRFWHLCREDGAIGVVLPRSAVAAAGSSKWRETVLDMGSFADVTLLLNNRKWVFDDVHPQWTVALVSIRKGLNHAGVVRMRGPFRDLPQFVAGTTDEEPVEFPTDEFRTWMSGAGFPLLPSVRSGDVFLKLRAQPRFDSDSHLWRARPITELHSTNDKHHMVLEETGRGELWPVYKGASFGLWTPDTGEYYAWADADYIAQVLQERRVRGLRNRRSAFSEMESDWADDPSTLPCRAPRLAYRRVTNRTNRRSLIVALVPPEVTLTDKAPFLLWPRGGAFEQAFVLGVLSSLPLDWYVRRVIEIQVDYHVLNALPIPDSRGSLAARVSELAGTLAWVDDRFSNWAIQAGATEGPIADSEDRTDLITELDAAVSLLYGLSPEDIKHIFDTFHEGWDPSERLEQVLAHYQCLKAMA